MKKTISFSLPILLGAAGVLLGQDNSTTANQNGSYEELPELKASEILKPEFVKGPHFSVREPVTTTTGANEFVIDSDYGVFEAGGNEMLVQRIKEIETITQLKDVSRTDQFKDSLTTAAKAPINAAKNVIEDPGAAFSNAGKGLMKFMKRTGQTVKNVSQGKTEKSRDNTAESAIGYSRAKRKIAVEMGVDPYTTNRVLQKELDGIAWASWAGGFAFSAATFPISGPAGAALSVSKMSSSIGQLISEKTPTELKAINRSALRGMGVSASDCERFLENTAFTPSQQTEFVMNLKALQNVQNRGAFVHAAAETCSSDADALFCILTSELMGRVNAEKPFARIVTLGDFPLAIANDGTVVLALQWDSAAWTPAAATFASQIQELAHNSGNKGVLIALSGDASSRLKQELQSRGFTVHDRVSPGPLK